MKKQPYKNHMSSKWKKINLNVFYFEVYICFVVKQNAKEVVSE